jgi:fructoselysine-6-P-deglycase FrlB-like protein
MDSAEFRQGPIEVVDEKFGGIIFIQDGFPGQLSCQLADELQRSGGWVYRIGNGRLCSGGKTVQFQISEDAGVFYPVLEVAPIQVLAYKLAESQGIQPGAVRYITKVITSESGFSDENQGSADG